MCPYSIVCKDCVITATTEGCEVKCVHACASVCMIFANGSACLESGDDPSLSGRYPRGDLNTLRDVYFKTQAQKLFPYIYIFEALEKAPESNVSVNSVWLMCPSTHVD